MEIRRVGKLPPHLQGKLEELQSTTSLFGGRKWQTRYVKVLRNILHVSKDETTCDQRSFLKTIDLLDVEVYDAFIQGSAKLHLFKLITDNEEYCFACASADEVTRWSTGLTLIKDYWKLDIASAKECVDEQIPKLEDDMFVLTLGMHDEPRKNIPLKSTATLSDITKCLVEQLGCIDDEACKQKEQNARLFAINENGKIVLLSNDDNIYLYYKAGCEFHLTENNKGRLLVIHFNNGPLLACLVDVEITANQIKSLPLYINKMKQIPTKIGLFYEDYGHTSLCSDGVKPLYLFYNDKGIPKETSGKLILKNLEIDVDKNDEQNIEKTLAEDCLEQEEAVDNYLYFAEQMILNPSLVEQPVSEINLEANDLDNSRINEEEDEMYHNSKPAIFNPHQNLQDINDSEDEDVEDMELYMQDQIDGEVYKQNCSDDNEDMDGTKFIDLILDKPDDVVGKFMEDDIVSALYQHNPEIYHKENNEQSDSIQLLNDTNEQNNVNSDNSDAIIIDENNYLGSVIVETDISDFLDIKRSNDSFAEVYSNNNNNDDANNQNHHVTITEEIYTDYVVSNKNTIDHNISSINTDNDTFAIVERIMDQLITDICNKHDNSVMVNYGESAIIEIDNSDSIFAENNHIDSITVETSNTQSINVERNSDSLIAKTNNDSIIALSANTDDDVNYNDTLIVATINSDPEDFERNNISKTLENNNSTSINFETNDSALVTKENIYSDKIKDVGNNTNENVGMHNCDTIIAQLDYSHSIFADRNCNDSQVGDTINSDHQIIETKNSDTSVTVENSNSDLVIEFPNNLSGNTKTNTIAAVIAEGEYDVSVTTQENLKLEEEDVTGNLVKHNIKQNNDAVDLVSCIVGDSTEGGNDSDSVFLEMNNSDSRIDKLNNSDNPIPNMNDKDLRRIQEINSTTLESNGNAVIFVETGKLYSNTETVNIPDEEGIEVKEDCDIDSSVTNESVNNITRNQVNDKSNSSKEVDYNTNSKVDATNAISQQPHASLAYLACKNESDNNIVSIQVNDKSNSSKEVDYNTNSKVDATNAIAQQPHTSLAAWACNICENIDVHKRPVPLTSKEQMKSILNQFHRSNICNYICLCNIHLRMIGGTWQLADNCEIPSNIGDSYDETIDKHTKFNIGNGYLCTWVSKKKNHPAWWMVKRVNMPKDITSNSTCTNTSTEVITPLPVVTKNEKQPLEEGFLSEDLLNFQIVYTKPLQAIIVNICMLFQGLGTDSQRYRGDDLKSPEMGWLIRRDFCTVIAQLLLSGLSLEKSILKNVFNRRTDITLWKLVKDFSLSYGKQEFISIIDSIETNHWLKDNDIKFRFFICELLNRSTIDGSEKLVVTWFHQFPMERDKITQYYSSNSFWRMKNNEHFELLHKGIVLSLMQFNGIPFCLHDFFEIQTLQLPQNLPQGNTETIYC